MIVKMTILKLLCSSDDKEKIGKVRPGGSALRSVAPEEPTHDFLVQKGIEAKSAYRHRMNRCVKMGHQCIGRTVF